MLRVNTVLKESNISGIGLFANEFIPQGTLIFKYDPGFDSRFPEKLVVQMGHKSFFDHYAVYDSKTECYHLALDNTRFINHSNEPNIKYDSNKLGSVALIDINIGEEITEDYKSLEEDFDESIFNPQTKA